MRGRRPAAEKLLGTGEMDRLKEKNPGYPEETARREGKKAAAGPETRGNPLKKKGKKSLFEGPKKTPLGPVAETGGKTEGLGIQKKSQQRPK